MRFHIYVPDELFIFTYKTHIRSCDDGCLVYSELNNWDPFPEFIVLDTKQIYSIEYFLVPTGLNLKY